MGGNQRLGGKARRLSPSWARTQGFNHCIKLIVGAQLMLIGTDLTLNAHPFDSWEFQAPWTTFSEGPRLLLSRSAVAFLYLPFLGSLPQHTPKWLELFLAHLRISGLQVFSNGSCPQNLINPCIEDCRTNSWEDLRNASSTIPLQGWPMPEARGELPAFLGVYGSPHLPL